MTPDSVPANSKDPASWNRYSYVEGDPINYFDPRGRFQQAPGTPGADDGGGDDPGQTPFNPGNDIPSTWWEANCTEFGTDCPAVPQQAPGGPVGAAQSTAAQQQTALASAMWLAQEALKDPGCAALFNTSGNGSHSPSAVLSALNGGDEGFYIGSISFQDLGTVNYAQTQLGGYLSGRGWTVADITINSTVGYFVGRDVIAQVNTLLHELGHVFDLLPSLGGSVIQDEILPDGSTSDPLEKANYDALYPCRVAAGLAMDQ